jgi:hypothetical protein
MASTGSSKFLDRSFCIHGDDHHWRVLGQRQRLIGSEEPSRPEPTGATQHDAASNAAPFIQAEQQIGNEAVAGPSTLGQIRTEL